MGLEGLLTVGIFTFVLVVLIQIISIKKVFRSLSVGCKHRKMSNVGGFGDIACCEWYTWSKVGIITCTTRNCPLMGNGDRVLRKNT